MQAMPTGKRRNHDIPPVRAEPDDDRPEDDRDRSHQPDQQGVQSSRRVFATCTNMYREVSRR